MIRITLAHLLCLPYWAYPVVPSPTPMPVVSSVPLWVRHKRPFTHTWFLPCLLTVIKGQPSFIEYMGLATNTDAESLIGAAVSLFYVGGVFGAVLNSLIADRLGRKWTAVVASIILCVATGCLAGSVNIAMFIAFRFFVGMG